MENLRPTQLYFRNCFTFLFSWGLFLTPSVLEAQIMGTVFRDFNGNGTKDANEPLVSGITINAYNSANTLCGTTTSAGSTAPNYSLTGCGTASTRIEFVMPSTGSCANSGIDFSALGGTTYGSSIQFVNGNSTNVNFAVHNPSDYNTGTTGVNVFIPCYISGDPLPANSPSGALDWFVGYPYTNSGNTTTLPPSQKLNGAIIGSTWGVAYSKQAQKVFTSAFIKRHVGLGTLGTGGIYLLTPTANSFTVNSFYDLDANNYRTRADATAPAYGEGTSYSIAADNSTITYLGATDALTGKPSGLGVIGTNVQRGLSTAIEIPSYDPAAFDQIGKVGLGDIDISDDGKYLFVMNLYSRKVFRLELNDAYNPTSVVSVTSYDVPSTTCTNGEYRPWGLKFFRNKLYVGVVCSGENAGVAANLNASVYELNNPTASASFNTSALITVPLNYTKTGSYKPWTNNSGSVTSTTYPQPILSDIEITDNGDMVLSIMDRAGNQWGENNRKFLKTSTTSITLSTSGDILIAGLNCSTGTLTSENNGTVTSANGTVLTGSSNINSGPGGKEFFDDNSTSGDPHPETAIGALAVLKGQGEVLLPAFAQSSNSGDAGTMKLSTTNGAFIASSYYELYNRNFNGILAKANGLGDVELSGAEAPIEVGNRVWSDTDNDGIQDAGEAGIDGVIVKLFEGTTEVGSTTTANGGQYYFTDANVTGGLKYSTAYEIRIATAQTPLSSLSLTTTDVGTNGSDLIDNDGTISGANAIKTFTTGLAGQNNHSYDFGFSTAPACTPPSLTGISSDTATCTNGVANSNAAVHVTGITSMQKYVYGTNGTATLYYANATSSTSASIDITGLANPSVATTYTFRIYASDSTCYNDTTVVLNPSVCACTTFNVPLLTLGSISFGSGSAPLAENVTTNGSFPLSENNIVGFYVNPSSEGVFYTFCTEISQPLLPLQNPYTHELNNSTSGFTTSQALRIAQVMQATGFNAMTGFGAGNNTNVNMVAMQMAIWNAFYDTDYSVSTGNFQLLTDNNNAKAICNNWLTVAQAITTPSVVVHRLHNPTGQDLLMIGDVPPITAAPIAPSCTGVNVPNNGGITITGFTTGQRYQYSTGTTFNGGSAIPASITAIPAGGVITNTLTNTNSSYTVRVYDVTDDACYTDRTVTIKASDCINLVLSKTVDSSCVSVAGRTVNFTLKVKNISASNATGVTVKVTSGLGFTFVSAVPSVSYTSGTGIWTIGAVNAGDSATLVLTVKADSIGVNYCTAEINSADQTDSNSTPNNGVTTEDDIARACVSVPMPLCPNQTYQAALPSGLTGIQWYKNGTAISGETNQTLNITEVGEYTFTANESTCPVQGCCPIKVIAGTCTLPCKPMICLPVAVVRQ